MTVRGFKDGRQQRKEQERKLKCRRRKCGKFGLGRSSRKASVFEASEIDLAETGCVDIVNVDLNTLEIEAVLLLERSRDSEWNRCCGDCDRCQLNEKLHVLFGSECSTLAEMCEVLVTGSESDVSHDVFFPCYDKGTQARAHHEGGGTKLELELNRVLKLLVEIVLRNVRTTGTNGISGLNSSLSELEIEDMTSTTAESERKTVNNARRRAREDATRRVAMSSGERHS